MDVHEISLIESVVALVEDERRKQDFSRVRLIRLKLGALGHAEPEALHFCFDAVTRGAIAEGARLDIDIVPGEGWRLHPCHLALRDRGSSALERADGARTGLPPLRAADGAHR